MNNILFFGTYQHKVDSKGRVSIPAEWRKHLIENKAYYYIFNQLLKCRISIESIKNDYPKSDYDFNMEMLPRIMQLNLDTEGRTVFKQAKGKTAILKGCGDYFTIEFRLDN